MIAVISQRTKIYLPWHKSAKKRAIQNKNVMLVQIDKKNIHHFTFLEIEMKIINHYFDSSLLSSVYFYSALATKPPRWDPIHTVKGILYIPYAEIEEPFEAWYDKHTNRSRIDYYGGTVKTYQLSRDGEFGTSLKVAPVTTDEKANEITCLQVNGTSDNRIEPQSILPNCKDFQLAGKD